LILQQTGPVTGISKMDMTMMTMLMMTTFGWLLWGGQEQVDWPIVVMIFGCMMIFAMITGRRESVETNPKILEANQSRATTSECIQVLQTLYQLRRDLYEEHVKLNGATTMQGIQPHTSVEKSLLSVIVQIAQEEHRLRCS
jgi:ABC-type bacteriocin/lantibiotic exporter with double-glycine peptidase domain